MIDIEDRIKQKKFDEISEFNDNKYALARIEDKVGLALDTNVESEMDKFLSIIDKDNEF